MKEYKVYQRADETEVSALHIDKNTWDIKEWKEELNVEVKVYYLERNATVEDLKYFDAVQVKKYLDERG